MKVITIKKKTIFKLMGILAFLITLCGLTTTVAMQHYYKVDFSTGLVTASKLNVRSGPGINYSKITAYPDGTKVVVYQLNGNWICGYF